MLSSLSLSYFFKLAIFFSSLLIVGCGQPAFSAPLSLAACLFGYALFWQLLLSYPLKKHRFWLSTAWFTSIQLIQLSWFLSHPYYYIVPVYLLISFLMGLQFGWIGLYIQPRLLTKISNLVALAGLWTLLEWSRLFLISGFSWNPSGLALSSTIYTLQLASLAGVYGLSFWVFLTNLLALRYWLLKGKALYSWLLAAAFPFIYGAVHLAVHEPAFIKQQSQMEKNFTALLVQTAFPIEEILEFKTLKERIAYVLAEWRQILQITQPFLSRSTDLVALPEFTVPYGTYAPIFPYTQVEKAFKEIYGTASLAKLPALREPLASLVPYQQGHEWFVSNGYWLQALANIFKAEVVAGLEDVEDREGERYFYSAALHFEPETAPLADFLVNRYEKRVLVPMGEYIPLSFITPLKTLASSYGITNSFTCGKEAKIFGKKIPLGFSICYEETFGDVMRENRLKGAELLVNLTSDVWYPFSRLNQQHFDHARLRTVENGIPLIRACNTGITAAIDSLGRIVAKLGNNPQEAEWLSAALRVEVPTYHYRTLYSLVGDKLIVIFSLLAILFSLWKSDEP